MENLEDELHHLLALHPKEFIQARRSCLERLVEQGRGEDASTLSVLRRPTAAVWACNQLVRRQSDRIEALVRLGADWRTAAQARWDNETSLDRELALGETLCDQLVELTATAKAVLEQASLPRSTNVLHSIYKTLEAFSVGPPGGREVLLRGLIRREESFDARGQNFPAPTRRFPRARILSYLAEASPTPEASPEPLDQTSELGGLSQGELAAEWRARRSQRGELRQLVESLQDKIEALAQNARTKREAVEYLRRLIETAERDAERTDAERVTAEKELRESRRRLQILEQSVVSLGRRIGKDEP